MPQQQQLDTIVESPWVGGSVLSYGARAQDSSPATKCTGIMNVEDAWDLGKMSQLLCFKKKSDTGANDAPKN